MPKIQTNKAQNNSTVKICMFLHECIFIPSYSCILRYFELMFYDVAFYIFNAYKISLSNEVYNFFFFWLCKQTDDTGLIKLTTFVFE